MADQHMNTYEGLFLFQQAATANLQGAIDHIQELLKRADADVLSLRKWEERRLAYEIKGNKRGVYFLVYFKAAPTRLVGLERDCNLSEQLLRSMILRADHVRPEEIEAADGRAQLADEIRLRSEQAAPAKPPAESKDDETSPDIETATAVATAEDKPTDKTDADDEEDKGADA
jgi:small subunit ribosomal protein S6